MSADPLSDVLSLLRPQSALSVGVDIAGPWCFRFAGHEGIKFNAALRGTCFLHVGHDGEWHRIKQGGCFLLTQGLPFTLASDPDLPPRDAADLYRDVTGPVATWNGGGDFYLIGGRFTFARSDGADMLAALPPVIVVDSTSPHAAVVNWSLAQLADEQHQARPGTGLLSDHLSHFMLVHILRLYLEGGGQGRDASWLNALSDRRMAQALSVIHADPARSWTLAQLASHVGMSRTVFAQRFRQVIGRSPMDYLTRWRMLLARDRLRHTADTVATIALSVGYRSEAAFSTAFRRLHHDAPHRFRRSQT